MNAVLVKNAHVYAPEDLGRNDILLVNDKIAALAPDITLPACLEPALLLDAEGRAAVPGFIDAHVHITGGGGEAGFHTQVPPLPLSVPLSGGVTTLGGLLGTDGVTRHVDNVLAKACSLEEEGLSTFIMTGGYPLPSPTITGSVTRDFACVSKVRGGKIAIADHRVAPVSAAQLAALATDVRVGGMLRGIVGMLIIHIGAAPEGLARIFEVIDQCPYLARHLIATHINRSPQAFEQAMLLARRGGFMDVSSGLNSATLGPDTLKPSTAIAVALRSGVPPEQILMSSDGNGSAARYDDQGHVEGLVASDLRTLCAEFRECVLAEGLSMTQALAPVTSNVAKAFSLFPAKVALAAGSDADVLVLDADLRPWSLFAKGRHMLHEGRVLCKGTFEE